jgi:hypothetical protein
MGIVKDLGMRYDEKAKRNHRWCLFQCPDCLELREIKTKLAKSITRCARCANKVAANKRTKHGKADRNYRLYNIWSGMRNRCYSKSNTSYHLYGGKGVTICKEWSDFKTFEQWALKNGYTDELDLDKDELCEKLGIHPKVYSPLTCKWKPKKENSRSNVKLSKTDIEYIKANFKPHTNSYKVLAKQFNISERHIYDIIKK